jgi:hypothetical protein
MRKDIFFTGPGLPKMHFVIEFKNLNRLAQGELKSKTTIQHKLLLGD